MYKKILIPTDGSEFSEKCIDHALKLAKSSNSTVIFITVTVPYSISGLTGGWLDSHATKEEYDAGWAKEAQEILSKAENKAKAIGVKAETLHAVEISPAMAIVEAADQLQCDLIAMGSHGRRGIQRVLLGSQANEVLQTSKVPVLIVR